MRGIPVAFYAALAAVTVLLLLPKAALPPPDGAGGIPHLDKLVHAALYAGLALLGTRAHPRVRAPAMFGLLVAHGALVEVAQGVVPGRATDLTDLAADAVGAATVFARRRE